MRRISLIDRPIGLLRRQRNIRSSSPYLCLACKAQTTSFSTACRRTAPSNEKKTPYTEKIRRRIWGTDNPPGLEDPYGDGSAFDKLKKRRPETHEQEIEALALVEESQEPPTEVEERAADTGANLKKAKHIKALTETEAKSWEGLRWIGGPPTWAPEEDFEGFAPANATTDTEEVTIALHRAIVEVYAMKQTAKPLHELSTVFPATNLQDYDWTHDVQITPSPDGATIQVHEDTSLYQIMDSLEPTAMGEGDSEVEGTELQADAVANRSEVEPLEPKATVTEEEIDAAEDAEDPLVDGSELQGEDVISSWDPSWLQISLENPEVKFAVLKRTMQLTGIRCPDAATNFSSNTAQALLNILVTRPKPRKLADALSQKPDLLELPNVSVHHAKRSFYDKEMEIGRWKVIEEELEARGLDKTE